MTEFDPDPDFEEEDYDQNEFQRYFTVKTILLSVIVIVFSVLGLRRITGTGLSYSDIFGSSETFRRSGDEEVFLMKKMSKGRDIIILFNSKSKQTKELFVLNSAAKAYPNNQYITHTKVSQDGKIVCFCRKTNGPDFAIYRMDESGYNLNVIVTVDTCNYNFKSDGKGIIYTDRSERLYSRDFGRKESEIILEQEAANSLEQYLNPIIYEKNLYYIDKMTVKVRELLSAGRGGARYIYKFEQSGDFDFTPDWRHLIVTDFEKGTIHIYDRITLNLLKIFRPIVRDSNCKVPILRTFFSSDGKYIYVHRITIIGSLKRVEEVDAFKDVGLENHILRIEYQACLDGEVGGQDVVEVEYEVVEFAEDMSVNSNIAYKPFVNVE